MSNKIPYCSPFNLRWYNDTLEIWAYVYNRGTLNFAKITDIQINRWYDFCISIHPNSLQFTVNSQTLTLPRTNSCEKGVYYILQPYWGGENPAPHNVTISIN